MFNITSIKTGIIAALTFISTSAFAFPTVGDFAEYKMVTNQGGSNTEYTMRGEVKSVNLSAGNFVVTQTMYMGGMMVSQDEQTQTIEEALNMMNSVPNCAMIGQMGGFITEVVQVNVLGNNMSACKIKAQDGSFEMLMGNVPFGAITATTNTQGVILNMTLTAYKMQ